MIPVTSPETLGKVLRHYRKNRGLTQVEAGGKFNLPQKTVSRVETGAVATRLDTVFKYMAALGLEMHLELRDKPSNEKAPW
ncbi:MAG: helix-turn-helix transcriptional regulator [Gammaproteobacteria bacterium]|nr:helix-turn-helix transcriptional regulator [Gammaproteobacteria bacterium]MDE0285209.1 helix-turn-helix transcriptional regulator [Gammaproteobacteria bacterium]MDE0511037.1 helix-turn-helix transcriptional regulator [Gammaproteobacteria bacterium]